MPELTARELAEICGAELDGDANRIVDGLATLERAGPREVSFLANPKYARYLEETGAGAVLVGHEVVRPREDLVLIRCGDPGNAFSRVVRFFAASPHRPPEGVHSTAIVDPTACLEPKVSIGPLCVVGPEVRIQAASILHAGVYVGAGCSIGRESEIHPGVVLYPRVSIGARCVVHAGTVLGSDGFGFELSGAGWVKVPQCGNVVVEDDVEIGAGCTIDRGRFGSTLIGRGTKLDNQVHLGHNVVVGENNLLVAQVGIAGSARTKGGVVLGGQVGVAGHVEIGPGARVAGQGGVYGDLAGNQDYLGTPAEPRRAELRRMAHTRRIPLLMDRLHQLEKRVSELEGRPER